MLPLEGLLDGRIAPVKDDFSIRKQQSAASCHNWQAFQRYINAYHETILHNIFINYSLLKVQNNYKQTSQTKSE